MRKNIRDRVVGALPSSLKQLYIVQYTIYTLYLHSLYTFYSVALTEYSSYV